ncbi:MAG: hypothetical protein HQL12_01275 [Candidatus Omnitrophica bacterium]|nr:hypothetical protein [Candidatus Omnitrophota bacterium]
MKNFCSWIYRVRFEAIAVICFVVGFYVRLQRLAGRSLWGDEIYQLSMTTGAFKPVWLRLGNGEPVPFPGDYLLKWPFVHFLGTQNKWLINSPHYVATLLAFWLFYKIGKKYIVSWIAFAIAFIFMTFNQWLVYHAFEFRSYAVLPTLALACFYFADMLFPVTGQDNAQLLSQSKRIGIGIFFFFVTIYHAYGLLMVVSCLFFVILRQWPRRRLNEIMKGQGAFFIIFAVLLSTSFFWFLSGGQEFTRAQCLARGIGTFDYIINPLVNPARFLSTVASCLMGFKKFKVNLLIWGVLAAYIVPYQNKKDHLLFFLILIVIPIEAMLTADVLKGYWFLQRQFVWVMPFFALLIGWSWDIILNYTKLKFETKIITNFSKKIISYCVQEKFK